MKSTSLALLLVSLAIAAEASSIQQEMSTRILLVCLKPTQFGFRVKETKVDNSPLVQPTGHVDLNGQEGCRLYKDKVPYENRMDRTEVGVIYGGAKEQTILYGQLFMITLPPFAAANAQFEYYLF